MGFREVADVFDAVHGIPPAQKLILVALADRADELGVSWPSVDELCRRTCQSKSTVLRHLRTLQSSGLVEVRHRRTKLPDGRYVQAPNLYSLDLTGIRAGKYSQVRSGCQNDTLKNSKKENPRSKPGCQNDTLNASGCQNKPFQGVTGDTHTKDQPNNHPSPQPPMVGEGSAAPTGAGTDGPAREGGDFLVSSSLVSGCASAPTSGELRKAVRGSKGPIKVKALSGGGSSLRDAESDRKSDSALIARVLPGRMSAIPVRDYAKVAQAIRQRLKFGWTENQIRSTLESRALPEKVRHMTALVLARLRDDIPSGCPPMWVDPQIQAADQVARPLNRLERDLAQARVEFVCDKKAGEEATSEGFEAWLRAKHPRLVTAL